MDLTAGQIAGARQITFAPYTFESDIDTGWDYQASVNTSSSNSLAVFKFDAIKGATYDIFSYSYFGSHGAIYDVNGRELGAFGEFRSDFVAPMSGTFYVTPGWDQGSYYVYASLDVYEDRDSAKPNAGPDSVLGTPAGEWIDLGNANDTAIALDGDDTILGGSGNDDLNGNVGNDSVHGGDGADWVRGGKGDDTITGGRGHDPHVNGNIGNDIVYGGSGDDTIYGGQDNDTLYGEAGYDLLSGDLGNDVLYGGPGSDRFTIAPGGGVDWIADFKEAEGDRILLAKGVAYTVTMYAGQVMIDLGGGTAIGLVGVSTVGDWLAQS